MALWVCSGEAGCSTKYAVGLSRCPRCHNTEFHEDGDPMAKISRHGGASDDTLPVAEPEVAAAAEPDPMPAAAADQPDEAAFATGGVVASPEALREHARNLVEPDFSESLAKAEATQETGEEAPPEQDYETWTVEQLKDQLDRRGLPKTGKKDDLVLRLLEDDDTRTTQPETE